MKKRLDISTVLVDFVGQPIRSPGPSGGPPKDIVLKDVLLGWIASAETVIADRMKQMRLYQIGMKLGQATDLVELEQSEYDVLKELCDNPGKVALIVSQQVKRLIDAAVTIE